MANIPGINGYVQPGTFARDRVISRGVSIPGGSRILCIMGEGLREETIVSSAVGGGLDGSSSCSPSGSGEGKFFQLQFAPVISGRTELYLNGSLLFGKEDEIDVSSFEQKYDFRLDPVTGCIELQGARISDQGGKNYSASSGNSGNGIIVDGTCGTLNLIEVVDSSAPGERWTIRAVSVIRDSSGNPIPGKTTFTASGSVSGQLKDANGNPFKFTSSYYTGTLGAIAGNEVVCNDAFVVASSDAFGDGSADLDPDDLTTGTTNLFIIDGNLLTQGQAIVGDYLCIDGYVGIEIEDIAYNSSDNETTLTLVSDSLTTDNLNVAWEIRANNVFIDNPSISHNATTGVPVTAGSFTSADVGKILVICSGDAIGRYLVTAVTSSRRLRIEAAFDGAYPSLSESFAEGLAEGNLTFHLLQTNGVLVFGVKEGTIPFEVGDKFFIDVYSRVLSAGDSLTAKYISELDLNDPELFSSASDLAAKHGTASVTNTLSLGSLMAYEAGAPFVLAMQCKPPVPRRTTAILFEEENSNGVGGYRACGGDTCQVDDLLFPIPFRTFGLGTGRPDESTNVNIFVTRNGVDTQIFPNKFAFYSSALESPSAQNTWINSSANAYSYTVINSDTKIDAVGTSGSADASSGTFTTLEYDFSSADIGKVIVVQSLENMSSTVYTTTTEIGTYLFGSAVGVELLITGIVNDSTVTVVANDGDDTVLDNDAQEIQFFIKDVSDTTNVSPALLLHKDLVTSGTLKAGDGIKITYIDENDADFFDTNWFEALEVLESADCQMIAPLPLQTKSAIFRSVINHCNLMSSISVQKERHALIGAIKGLTAAALIGTEEVAIEDIGILEGIQGDDVTEVLSGDVEDLANYKLLDNYNELRAQYFVPDVIIRNVAGTNVELDGFYLSAFAGGWFAGSQNLALPLTNKNLPGFTIPRSRKYRPAILNALGAAGATVVQPAVGGGLVLASRTTSQSGFVEDEEPSIVFIRDRVKQGLRDGMKGFIGTNEDVNTQGVMSSKISSLMSSFRSQGIITGYEKIRVEKDKVDPRQWNVFVRFTPAYPINYVFIDIEVGIFAE